MNKTASIFKDCPQISHGFFSRTGGVSHGIYKSLNTGTGSHDNPKHIRENRARVAKTIGAKASSLLSLHQIHSVNVITATKTWDSGNKPQADAIVTNVPGLACTALAADCAPVLLADPVAGVIGAAHAGWRGALAGIVDNTVLAMAKLGAKPENIRACIGPCIGPQNFEVGPEFVEAFLKHNQANKNFFQAGDQDRSLFDLKAYLLRRLALVGVLQSQALPDCTYADPANYFSYRYNTHAKITDYGRNISVIMLKNR